MRKTAPLMSDAVDRTRREEAKHTAFTHTALEITDVEAVTRQLESHDIAVTEFVEYEGVLKVKYFFRELPRVDRRFVHRL